MSHNFLRFDWAQRQCYRNYCWGIEFDNTVPLLQLCTVTYNSDAVTLLPVSGISRDRGTESYQSDNPRLARLAPQCCGAFFMLEATLTCRR